MDRLRRDVEHLAHAPVERGRARARAGAGGTATGPRVATPCLSCVALARSRLGHLAAVVAQLARERVVAVGRAQPLGSAAGERLAVLVGLVAHALGQRRRHDLDDRRRLVRPASSPLRSTMSPRGASMRTLRTRFSRACGRRSPRRTAPAGTRAGRRRSRTGRTRAAEHGDAPRQLGRDRPDGGPRRAAASGARDRAQAARRVGAAPAAARVVGQDGSSTRRISA